MSEELAALMGAVAIEFCTKPETWPVFRAFMNANSPVAQIEDGPTDRAARELIDAAKRMLLRQGSSLLPG